VLPFWSWCKARARNAEGFGQLRPLHVVVLEAAIRDGVKEPLSFIVEYGIGRPLIGSLGRECPGNRIH